jgi:hypothetical protein
VLCMGTPIRAQQQNLQQDSSTSSAAALTLHRLACCQRLPRPGQCGQVWCCGNLSVHVCARLPGLSAHAAPTTSLPGTARVRTIQRASGAGMRPHSTVARIGDVRGGTWGIHPVTRPTVVDSAGSCAAVASLQSARSSSRTSVRWKTDDEAVAASLEHGGAHAGDNDDEPDPNHDPFTPSMPEDQHYDPHRDHRDRDHAALGEKHLNAANVDHERLKKHSVHKEIKRLRERKHDAVSRPEL